MKTHNAEYRTYKKNPPESSLENYDNGTMYYPVASLLEEAKKYEEFDLPLDGIDLRTMFESNIKSGYDFFYHSMKVEDCDPQKPIILDVYGSIADGRHRIIKALMLGWKTIKAIRLETMPRGFEVKED